MVMTQAHDQYWLVGISGERVSEINNLHIERFGLEGHWHTGLTHPSNGIIAMPIHYDLVNSLTQIEIDSLQFELSSDWFPNPLP